MAGYSRKVFIFSWSACSPLLSLHSYLGAHCWSFWRERQARVAWVRRDFSPMPHGVTTHMCKQESAANHHGGLHKHHRPCWLLWPAFPSRAATAKKWQIAHLWKSLHGSTTVGWQARACLVPPAGLGPVGAAVPSALFPHTNQITTVFLKPIETSFINVRSWEILIAGCWEREVWPLLPLLWPEGFQVWSRYFWAHKYKRKWLLPHEQQPSLCLTFTKLLSICKSLVAWEDSNSSFPEHNLTNNLAGIQKNC